MFKDLRKSKGLSQIQVASFVNVTQQMVSRWEKGISFPRLDKLNKLAELFGCSLSELVKEFEEKEDEGIEC